MSTTAELNTKVLNFTEIAADLGGMVKKYAEESLAACNEARALVEKLADEQISKSRISEGERGEFAKKASTHVGALQLVGNFSRLLDAVTEKHAKELAALKLGQGVPASNGRQKKANVDSTESPFVGRRAGLGEKRSSDEALFSGLRINPADIKPRA